MDGEEGKASNPGVLGRRTPRRPWDCCKGCPVAWLAEKISARYDTYCDRHRMILVLGIVGWRVLVRA